MKRNFPCRATKSLYAQAAQETIDMIGSTSQTVRKQQRQIFGKNNLICVFFRLMFDTYVSDTTTIWHVVAVAFCCSN